MPRRLLIIESQFLSSANEACFTHAAPDSIWERIDWDPSLPDRVREKRPGLLIVVAVSAPKEATNLMAALQKKPLLTPMLAIIPNDAANELICLASRVVDDLIFAPVCTSELRYRIARIIGDPCSAVSDVDERLIQELTLVGLIGRSPHFLHEISKISAEARGTRLVLITGAAGTRK